MKQAGSHQPHGLEAVTEQLSLLPALFQLCLVLALVTISGNSCFSACSNPSCCIQQRMFACPQQLRGLAGDKPVGQAQQEEQGKGQLHLGMVSLRCECLPSNCRVASAAQCPEQRQQLGGYQALAGSPGDGEHELSIHKSRIPSQTHLCHLWGQVLR